MEQVNLSIRATYLTQMQDINKGETSRNENRNLERTSEAS
jgi:hypothetical protein